MAGTLGHTGTDTSELLHSMNYRSSSLKADPLLCEIEII